MSKMRSFLALAWLCMIVLFAGSLSPALAIRRAGGLGWGATTQYGQLFDLNTMETIRGKVVSVERFIPLRQMGWGLLVTVSTEKETIAVHVGPGWYLDRQGYQDAIEPGEPLTVRGSRITFNEEPAIIATEVRTKKATIHLRNEKGVPVWSEEETAEGEEEGKY